MGDGRVGSYVRPRQPPLSGMQDRFTETELEAMKQTYMDAQLYALAAAMLNDILERERRHVYVRYDDILKISHAVGVRSEELMELLEIDPDTRAYASMPTDMDE